MISTHLKNSENSQKGFTLVELLVYMAMSAIVVTIAAQVWMSFTQSSYKTATRMDTNLDIEQVLYYLSEDISRIGLKSNTSTGSLTTNADIFMSASDSSSFSHIQNGTTDSLTFKAAVFSSDSSIYLGYDSVSYFIDAKKLTKSVVFVDSAGAASAAVNTIMIDSVVGFDLEFGVYSSDGESNQMLGEVTSVTTSELADLTNSVKGGTALSLSNSATADFVDVTGFTTGDSCIVALNESGARMKFDDNGEGFVAGKTYKLTFNTRVNQTYADSFDLSQDTMFVLLRKFSGNWENTKGVPVYYFYPGVPDVTIEREFVFTPSQDVDEPSFYVGVNPASDLSSGILSIGPVSIVEMSDMEYNWISEFTGTAAEASRDRQNTRAISLTITVEHNYNDDAYDRTYELKKFIQLPNNGVR